MTETNFELDINPEDAQPANELGAPELEIEGQELQENKSSDIRTFDSNEAELQLADKRKLQLEQMDSGRIFDLAVEKMNSAFRNLIDAGLCFSYLKSSCDHGEYKKQLIDRGISPVRAFEAVKYAELASRLPENQQDKLFNLNKSQGMLLAQADPQIVNDILENDEKFEEYKDLTVRDMRNHLRKDKAALADKDIQIKTLENQLKVARNRHTQISDDSQQPLFVVEARHESVALNKQANLALDSLEHLMDEHLNRPYDADQAMFNKSVSRALFHSSNELLVRLSHLTAQMKLSFGEHIQGDVSLVDHLPDAEAIAIAKDYSLITQEHKHQELLRDQERQSKRPKTPGRPKKIVE